MERKGNQQNKGNDSNSKVEAAADGSYCWLNISTRPTTPRDFSTFGFKILLTVNLPVSYY
ncbi:unnamed protein product [Cuscuta europaea]|uniref:Uncharacterized protein n=1 Tax=Cuscuta europaea TaxID=41803 RepID=A0A9P0ZW92_CUSEU|nr:unnamed protein product [Cuscuta europaea]